MAERKRQYFGNAAHLIVSQWCRFHIATKVGKYLVSTVGEYWPERPVRETYARSHDPKWFVANIALRGDAFDNAYFRKFGYEKIGSFGTYETMVFRAGKPCECGCGIPRIDGSELDCTRYDDAKAATKGHEAACRKYERPRSPERP